MTTIEEMQKIVDAAFIDFYVATYQVKMNYPLRLEQVDESSPTVSDKATSYILDWGINEKSDEEVTNKDVLDRGEHLDAEILVPKDAIGDVGETLSQFEEFLLLYDEHEYDGDFLLPTQSDEFSTHAECYGLVKDLCQDYGYSPERKVAIGGINKKGMIEKVETCINMREAVGKDVDLHAFGVGSGQRFPKVVYHCPWLLDSVDNQTPANNGRRGVAFDIQMNNHDLNMPRGTLSSTWTAQLVEFNATALNYFMSDLPRENDVDRTIYDDELRNLVEDHKKWNGTSDVAGEPALAD